MKIQQDLFYGLSFFNLSPKPFCTGMISFPFGKGFFPRMDHASYRVVVPTSQRRKRQHSHPAYHILIHTGGSGAYIVDSEEIPAEKGLLLLVSPGVPHIFNNTPDETKEFCVVTFEWLDSKGQRLMLPFSEMLSQWSGQSCTLPVKYQLSEGLCADLVLEIEQMVKAGLRDVATTDLFVFRGLWHILYELTEYFSHHTSPAESESPLLRVRHYIQNHYREPTPLSELAKVACLTPNYLCHLFKKTFGVTPGAYQINLRIQAACSLLASSEYEVKQIAPLVGFEDIYYFYRVFKKATGQTPAAYRKEAFSRHRSA